MQQVRTTTGQCVTISYDAHRNTVIFSEADWFAEPLRRTGVPVKSQVRRALDAMVVRLPTRRVRGRRRAA